MEADLLHINVKQLFTLTLVWCALKTKVQDHIGALLQLCYILPMFWVVFSIFLQKKVNPELPVEIKPSNRAKKLQESKLKKKKQKAVLMRQRDDEQRWHMEMRSDLTLYHRLKFGPF